MEFNFNELISNLLFTVLTVAIPALLPHVISFVKAQIEKSNVVTQLTKNENLNEVINNALINVADAVVYVNQIYVNSLKKSGNFTEESQKDAFKLAYNEAVKLISDEAKNVIEYTYGSFEEWVYLQIEVAVNNAKK